MLLLVLPRNMAGNLYKFTAEYSFLLGYHLMRNLRKIRKYITAALVVLMISRYTLAASAISGADITSETAVLMDAETGEVLFEKDMNKRMSPASVTKIMTGLLAVEQTLPQEIITVSDAATDLPPGSSYIALSPGERLSVKDALYALMLPSANDAANALAEHISGSQQGFVALMNHRAKEIGAFNTNFENAHGLDSDNHKTTAYDLALITREAINNEDFLIYSGMGNYTMPATNIAAERGFVNQQYMLVDTSRFYNSDVIAGKVGYTRMAGHTMSTVAVRDGRVLICVVMNTSRDDKYYDTEKLLTFGFDEALPLVDGVYGASGIGSVKIEQSGGMSSSVYNINPVDANIDYLNDVSWFEPPAVDLASKMLPPPTAYVIKYAAAGFFISLMVSAVAAAIFILYRELRAKKSA